MPPDPEVMRRVRARAVRRAGTSGEWLAVSGRDGGPGGFVQPGPVPERDGGSA